MGDGPATGDGHGGADGAFEGGRRTSLSSASEADSNERRAKPQRPPLNRNDTTDDPTLSRNSTDDEGYIPAQVPLEILAGNALVTNYTDHDQFDWAGGDDDDEEEKNDKNKTKKHKQPGVVLCLSRNSSYIAWSLLILFALILIAIDVAVFVAYDDNVSMVSYNLQLWFTWAAFMWCVSILIQLVVELVPWAIKRLVGFLRPQSTEVLRMRLAYYMALRPFIKMLIVSAWNWGSWAFIRNQLALPEGQNRPDYVDDFYSVWQCVFFAALLLFIEKFVLQLIVTSFHKKAYGERISENDHALKILDRLKKTKRKAPQDFIFKRMRRNKERPTKTSRSNSADESPPHSKKANGNGNGGGQTQSIMRAEDGAGRGNVHFPTNNMDTLIAIPALESRSDDEKIVEMDEKSFSPEKQQGQQQQRGGDDPDRRASSDFVTSLTRRLRDAKANRKRQKQQQSMTSPPQVDSPPPLSRTNTWMSWQSDDRSFLKATNNTASIPGRLLKGGFKKLRSQSNNIVAPHGTSRQAKALAKRIFHNIVGSSGQHTISEKDLYPFFRTHQEAASAFQLFDRDGNGSIDKGELRSACVRIYRERKNLATSMRDLSQATGKLDIILMVIFVAIWVIIVCASFGVDVGTQLMPLWSAFIAASFVFGNSAKDAFESIIFVFVTHPFDAGDRVFIGEENWVVDQVGLLVSTFIKWDGSVVYAKNAVLATQYIINVRRTGITGETVDIHIAFSTPSWKIHRLRDHMMEWTDQFPHLYNVNGTTANIISFENQNRITVTMYFEHNKNWQDLGDRWLRHNNFMMELKDECDRLEINYVLPSQPFESSKKECPPETNNMGKKKSYGQEGMRMRQGFPGGGDDDDNQFRGDSGGPGGPAGAGGNDNSGAEAGAASALVFTTAAM